MKRTIEFDLPEELEETVEALEKEVEDNESIVAGIRKLYPHPKRKDCKACASAISELQAESVALLRRLEN